MNAIFIPRVSENRGPVAWSRASNPEPGVLAPEEGTIYSNNFDSLASLYRQV